MDLLTTTLIIVICYAFYYYFKRKLSYFEKWGIPYLPGWPIFGNLGPATLRLKHFSETIKDFYNVHPDAKYVGGFDFMRPIIVLRDPELIKNVTIKNFDHFPNHKTFIDNEVEPIFASNLFNSMDEKWREARNLLTPAFTSSKMKGMFGLIIKCGKNFVDYLDERSEAENKMIDSKDLFTKFTNDAIATCAFGIEVNSLKDPNNEFYVNGKVATNAENLTLKFFLSRAFPNIFKWLKIHFIDERITSFFKTIIKTAVDTRDEKGINRPDMLQLMMDARGKDHKFLKLDITEMTAQAFIFFFGGFDATSTQMCIIAHELAINSDIQKKLQDEIDETLKKIDGDLTYEIVNDMPYLDAVFKESLRMHTQVTFIDRLCSKEYELPPALPGAKPFTVPPGMNIWIPTTAIHKDPKYYENPNKFDPERYYNKKLSNNDVYNLGFGIGPRSCIGNRFAILETKILFFYLLAKFNIRPNARTCNPMRYSLKNLSLTAEGGYWLSIEPRLNK